MDNNAFKNFINQDFLGLSNWINSLNPYEFSLIATIIGFLVAPPLSANEQNSLGNFFELIGQVLLSIAAQNMTVSQSSQNQSASQNQNLYQEIEKIKNELNKLRRDIFENENPWYNY